MNKLLSLYLIRSACLRFRVVIYHTSNDRPMICKIKPAVLLKKVCTVRQPGIPEGLMVNSGSAGYP